MPANLPPQYFEIEKLYRSAKTPQEKIQYLQAMLSVMPKHKGTDKLRAELRRKIAKLEEEAERKSGGRRGGGLSIRKEGAGQVVLVGLPNAGKTRLVNALAGTDFPVADYPFTTQTPTPAMMKFENIQIQLIDMPPITGENARPWFSTLLRSADLMLIVLDLGEDPSDQMKVILSKLEEMRIKPLWRGGDGAAEDMLLFHLKKALLVGMKGDLEEAEIALEIFGEEFGKDAPLIRVSAETGEGIEELRRAIFEGLEIIRVYTKRPGEKPDFSEPVIAKKGSTVQEVAELIHKDFGEKLKFAEVWGSGKFGGQRVGRDYILQDGDIVEFHI